MTVANASAGLINAVECIDLIVSDEEQNEEAVPGRGQKIKRKQHKDPALLQAEQILEAGHHAVNMQQG